MNKQKICGFISWHDVKNYMKNPDSEPSNVYRLLYNENFIPSSKFCKFIITHELFQYVTIISEYHLGAVAQNTLFDMREKNMSQMKIINYLMNVTRQGIPEVLDFNIKKSIIDFITKNYSSEITDKQTEIINLFLDAVHMDKQFKNQLRGLILNTVSNDLKKALEVRVGVDPLLNSIMDKVVNSYWS